MERFRDYKSDVTSVEIDDDDALMVVAKGETRLSVGRIPASGGARGEPPTNPPETITEEHEVIISIHHDLHFEGETHTEIHIY